jgi:hypothetical protein
VSEPHAVSVPLGVSDPITKSVPSEKRETLKKSVPYQRIEPSRLSVPNGKSEPSRMSVPIETIEFWKKLLGDDPPKWNFASEAQRAFFEEREDMAIEDESKLKERLAHAFTERVFTNTSLHLGSLDDNTYEKAMFAIGSAIRTAFYEGFTEGKKYLRDEINEERKRGT